MDLGQVAGSRRKQILKALNENGPLSVDLLARIICPKMSVRSVQYVVHRLREKGLIVPHFESLNYNSGHFYRISHDLLARKRIAKWLGVAEGELRQPKFFSKELQHTAQCAMWAALLRDRFPDAEVLRDVQLVKNRLFRDVVPVQSSEVDLIPDVLLNFPGERKTDRVSIGIEIERTRKSEGRLVRKVQKLVARSQLDGVVYVCEAGGVRDAILSMLEKKQLLQSRRIRHYGRAFLLFTDCSEVHNHSSPKMYNIEGKSVSLEQWVCTLRRVSANFRRDHDFLTL